MILCERFHAISFGLAWFFHESIASLSYYIIWESSPVQCLGHRFFQAFCLANSISHKFYETAGKRKNKTKKKLTKKTMITWLHRLKDTDKMTSKWWVFQFVIPCRSSNLVDFIEFCFWLKDFKFSSTKIFFRFYKTKERGYSSNLIKNWSTLTIHIID